MEASSQLHTVASFTPNPLNNRLGGPQSQFRYFGEKQILSPGKNPITIPQMSSL